MEPAIRVEKRNGEQVLTSSTISQPNGNIREESSSSSSSSSSLSSLSSQGSTDTAQSRSQNAKRKREELPMCSHTLKEDQKKNKKRAPREAQDGQSLCPLEASNTRSHSNQETTSCSSSTTTINATRNGAKIASLKIKRPPGVRLVWVSTKKGVGAKMTHGVMYISKESPNGCKIVCHCHRSHFSLAQFVEHAGGSPPQIANPHMNIVVRMEFL